MEQQANVNIETNVYSNILKQMRLNRFCQIFFNLSIASLVVVGIAFVSSFLTPILYFFAIVFLFFAIILSIIFTFGAVFAMPSQPVAKMWSWLQDLLQFGDVMANVTEFCFNITKWISIIGIAFAILDIIIVAFAKIKHKTLKIVALSIIILLLGVVFAFQMLTGGVQWQG